MTDKIADRLKNSKYNIDLALNTINTCGVSTDSKDSFISRIENAVDCLKEVLDMYTRQLQVESGDKKNGSVILAEAKRIELWNRLDAISNKLNNLRGIIQNEMPVTRRDIDVASDTVDSICLDLSGWVEDLRHAFEIKE